MEASDQHGIDDDLEFSGAGAAAPGLHESPAPRMDAPSLDEARARSELARHLRPSLFPASADEIVDCAREKGAPETLLGRLATLPPDTYETVAQVWDALGGHTEHRAHTPDPEPEPAAEPALEPAPEHAPGPERFGFRFDPRYRLAAIPFGVHPENTYVEITGRTEPARLDAHFGPWHVSTTLDNVSAAAVTGPYAFLKTVGPPHVSFVDTGLTFATNGGPGVCISFRETVVGLDPLHLVHHPSLTVTVDDPDALIAALGHRAEREQS